MQTGSTSAPRELGWLDHVAPSSRVVMTAREPPRLSRMLSMSSPSRSSTTADSVVSGRAPVPMRQLSPPSSLTSTVECGMRARSGASWNCAGKTSRPSEVVMPRPGPWSR